jgi:hypothetical protein
MFYLRPCANCGVLIQGGRNLFCTELCRQAAKAVRYARGVLADGRFEPLDVQEAVAVKIALVAGGGYDERGRRLTDDVRVGVEQRSSGLCVECGAPGNEIDHIYGSSASPKNLQLLCRPCHLGKTSQSLHPAPEEMVGLVHRPIWERIGRLDPHQPSEHTRLGLAQLGVNGPWQGACQSLAALVGGKTTGNSRRRSSRVSHVA